MANSKIGLLDSKSSIADLPETTGKIAAYKLLLGDFFRDGGLTLGALLEYSLVINRGD